jgi:hypothetical protein
LGIPKQSVNLGDSIESLAELIASRKAPVDAALKDAGDQIVSIYENPNFSVGFQDYAEQRAGLLRDAIEDLAGGARLLSQCSLVIAFFENSLRAAPIPFDVEPPGLIVLKVGLKRSVAFRGWTREQAAELLPEEKSWPAIYRVVVAMAKPPR